MSVDHAPLVVIFDVFGTLLCPQSGGEEKFLDVIAGLGFERTFADLSRLQSYCDATTHTEESLNRENYLRWTDGALQAISTAGAIGALEQHLAALVPALEQWHQVPMEPYPDVRSSLSAIRAAGTKVVTCSNWGWDLDVDLRAAGVADIIDGVYTSARIGSRKPHPDIYRRVLSECSVIAGDALFVGDSVHTDVLGPRAVGISSLHLDRTAPSDLGRGRIASLDEILPWCQNSDWRRFASTVEAR